MERPTSPTDATARYRDEVIQRLRALDGLQRELVEYGRRIERGERDIVQMKQVLFGDPNVRQLRDGDRGGLVDLFREMQRQLKGYVRLRLLMVILIGVNVITLFKDIPPSVFKLIVGLVK